MANWIYNLFMSDKQYSKVFYFKYLGLFKSTKLWLHLLVSSSAFSFKKNKHINFHNIHLPIFNMYLLHITKFLFNIFPALSSNYSFSTSLQQTLRQSSPNHFLNFFFFFSCFDECTNIIMNAFISSLSFLFYVYMLLWVISNNLITTNKIYDTLILHQRLLNTLNSLPSQFII